MSQISPPIRILLVAVVGLMAAWMLFLRPKAVEEPVTATPVPNVDSGQPAVSEPGKLAQAAKNAADASNAQTEAQESLSGTPPKTGPGASPAPQAKGGSPSPALSGKVKGLPKPVAKAIDQRKVLVMLFWNRVSADDRAVRQAVRRVDRWDGEVRVHVAPVKKVSKYGRITRGADVSQSPTVLVVDRNLKVERLVGFVDTPSINQMVLDALRNSGGFIEDPYLLKVNQQCVASGRNAFGVPNPDVASEVPAYVGGQRRVITRFSSRVSGVKAPAKWRGFKRATVRDSRAMVALLGEWSAYLGSKPSVARVNASSAKFGPRNTAIGKRFNRRMQDKRLLACTSDW